jgi:hypothetical protein
MVLAVQPIMQVKPMLPDSLFRSNLLIIKLEFLYVPLPSVWVSIKVIFRVLYIMIFLEVLKAMFKK